MLVVGTILFVFAQHGPWYVPAAGWVYAVFLLRFARGGRVLGGTVALAVAMAVVWPLYLYEIGLPAFTPMTLLCVAIGLVMALAFLVDRLVTPRLGSAVARTVVFPAAVVGAEFALATVTPMGDVIGTMAGGQHANLALLQVTSVTGSYGVSFLMAWAASVATEVWQRWPELARVRAAVLAFAVTLGLVLVAGSVRLAASVPAEGTVRVAGVSAARSAEAAAKAVLAPGGGSLRRAAPAEVRRASAITTDDLLASTEREARAGAKIVVWPEGGTSTLASERDQLLARVADVAARTGTYVDAAFVTRQDTSGEIHNEAVMIDPAGHRAWQYRKAHPVPYMDNFAPGDGRVPTADTPYGRLANVICFDADFPALMRQQPGVDVMLVPSNDWIEFGRTHTERAVLKAVSNGYSLVRQDSRGVAMAIDPWGRVLSSADYFASDRQAMVADVPLRGSRTVYATIGDVFAWLCLAGLAGLAIVAIRRSGGRDAPVRADPAQHGADRLGSPVRL